MGQTQGSENNSTSQERAAADLTYFMDWTPSDIFAWCKQNREVKHLARKLRRLKITGKQLANVEINECVSEWGLSWLDAFKLLDERDDVVRLSALAEINRRQQDKLLNSNSHPLSPKSSYQWTKDQFIASLIFCGFPHLSVLLVDDQMTVDEIFTVTIECLVTKYGCNCADAFGFIRAREAMINDYGGSVGGMRSHSSSTSSSSSSSLWEEEDDFVDEMSGFIVVDYDE